MLAVKHSLTSTFNIFIYVLFYLVINWLNKQINETQMTHQRLGTFEMPGATSKFRPTGNAVVCRIINILINRSMYLD